MVEGSTLPQVGVIVPVHNRLGFLRQTIESLRAQTMSSAEYILIDDNSASETWAYLKSLPSTDHRFRILRKPPGALEGCQASKNIGLAECRAETVVFLDSDDLLAPECLENRFREINRSPDVDLLVGRQAMFWDQPASVKWVNVPRSDKLDLDRCLDLHDPLDVPWVNGGVMFRTGRIKSAQVLWRSEFDWDDLAFHFSCLVKGLKVRWMDYEGQIPDCYYRRHGQEHLSDRLHTISGLRNSGRMMLWMHRELVSAGMWSASRRRHLIRSYFYLCILRSLDQQEYPVAREMILDAGREGLLTCPEVWRLSFYAAGRRRLRRHPRCTYFLNQGARRVLLRGWLIDRVWTYGEVTPPVPATEQALEQLLRVCNA